MKIAIDLRSLSGGNFSGVENYAVNLVEHLLALDKQNTYTLFYNSFSKRPSGDLHFINSQVKATHYPNKVLNIFFKAGLTRLENLIGDFDCLFMPNANQFNIYPNTKLALTVHDLSFVAAPEFYDAKRRLWHWYLNFSKVLNRANKIFAVSQYTKYDIIKRFGVPEEKISVIYSGIDHSRFVQNLNEEKLREVRNKYSLPGNFLLSLGTVEPRKNIIGLIKAYEIVNSPAHLVIVGRLGWKYSEIVKAIKQSPKRRFIQYVGFVEESDKPYVMKLSQALVYPSFYEGFGFPPLESMAVGVPVIASSVTSLPEVVGKGALLVSPYNTQELVKALTEILKNDNLREQLIAAGLDRVKDFTWEKTAQKVLEGLNSL